MNPRMYVAVRGIARSVTMATLVTLPLAALFALEGWAQTW